MFLTELNAEEKKNFWLLVNTLVMADGVLEDEEEKLLNQYNDEMNESFEIEKEVNLNWKGYIDNLKTSSTRTQKIILFELIGAAYVDSDYDSMQKEIISYYCDTLSISSDDAKTLDEVVKEIFITYKKLGDILNG